jgi:hypothetical protein
MWRRRRYRRRRCGPRRRCRRTGRRGRRCRPRWRRGGRGRARRWRGLRRRLAFLAGGFLCLCHQQRRGWREQRLGLRVRYRGCELHRRQSGRGKQQKAKVCHDGVSPRKNRWQQKILGGRRFGLTINIQSLGRIVAATKTKTLFILSAQQVACVLVHCVFRRSFQIESYIVPCGTSGEPDITSGAEPGKSVIPASVAG